MSNVPGENYTGTSEGASSGIKSCWDSSNYQTVPTLELSTEPPTTEVPSRRPSGRPSRRPSGKPSGRPSRRLVAAE